ILMHFGLLFLLLSFSWAVNIEFRFNSPPFSQGLDLPLLQVINESHGENCRIQASFYELTYRPLVQALASARQRGCDVSVLLEQDNIKTIQDSIGKRDY